MAHHRFLPETSCELENKYLDRAVLVPTVEPTGHRYNRLMATSGFLEATQAIRSKNAWKSQGGREILRREITYP